MYPYKGATPGWPGRKVWRDCLPPQSCFLIVSLPDREGVGEGGGGGGTPPPVAVLAAGKYGDRLTSRDEDYHLFCFDTRDLFENK